MRSFDSLKFVNDIGRDLARDFKEAGQAITPGLTGVQEVFFREKVI